jgi:hypothetical protein
MKRSIDRPGGISRDVLQGDSRLCDHSPTLATVAVLSLTLGIGTNTVVISLVNGVMLCALPARSPERLA